MYLHREAGEVGRGSGRVGALKSIRNPSPRLGSTLPRGRVKLVT